MVKDKHVKAVAFMAKVKFTDKCIGYDAGEKQCCCLKKFLGEEICPMEAKKFYSNILFELWNQIGDDDDYEEMMKGSY